MPYTVEFWRIEGEALVDVTVEDVGHGNKQIASQTLRKTFQAEDRVVRAQPQYNIPDDPNDLPQPAQVETTLIGDMPTETRAIVEAALAGYHVVLDNDIRAAQGQQQCEMLGRALMFEEVAGATLPKHTEWEELVRAGCGAAIQNAAPAVAPGAAPAAPAR